MNDTPDPSLPQPRERQLVLAPSTGRSSLLKAVREAAALALDALDYAGDRVAERLTGDKRPPR